MRKNKRGISPLIATVLLVAFAVAMAAFVSTFVIKKTKEFKPASFVEDSALCDSVTLAYDIIKDPTSTPPDKLKLSLAPGVTNTYLIEGLSLRNKGSFSIYKITINAPGQSSDLDFTKKLASPKGLTPSTSTFAKDPDPGFITFAFKRDPKNKNIKIVPWVKDPDKDPADPESNVVCSKKVLLIDPVDLCHKVFQDPVLSLANCAGL